MRIVHYILLLSVLLSLLPACGWHLRGGGKALDIQQSIYLEGESGLVYQRIYKTLTRKKPIVDLTEADVQLLLGEEYWQRRSVSVNNQTRTTRYELTLTVPYKILDAASKPLVEETVAELSRSYSFNENDITGADKEEQLLRKEMARQLSRRILQRVMFLQKQRQ